MLEHSKSFSVVGSMLGELSTSALMQKMVLLQLTQTQRAFRAAQVIAAVLADCGSAASLNRSIGH